MKQADYVRALPAASLTSTLYTSRFALAVFDQFGIRRIVDIGSGDCFFEEHYPGRFVGLDIEETRLRSARARGVSELVLGSAEAIPFRTSCFDGVLLKDALEHFALEGAFHILREATRVLAPGGVLVVTTTKATQQFWDKPDHVRPYSNKWVRRVLVHELRQYDVIVARELSGGIPGFGRLRLEPLAHALADRLGIHNTHGIIALRKR